MKNLLAVAFGLSLGLVAACDTSTSSSSVNASATSGVVTLGTDEGIDFTTGVVQQPGNFGNSDLYTSQNGSAMKLTSGGANIVDVRPVSFFQTSGGVYPIYADLDDVPNVRPEASMKLPLPKADVGNGFTILTASGAYTKGFVVSASATSVTIQYEPLP